MNSDQQGDANAPPENRKNQEQDSADNRPIAGAENNAASSPAPADKSSDQRDDSEHRENERALVRWTRVVAFLTGGLIVVGAITGYIFYRQLNVMQGQLDAMERDEQPYVFITDNLGLPQFRPNTENPQYKGQIVWTWYFANLGKGRAYNLMVDQFFRIDTAPFKHTYGATGPGFGGDLPSGKNNFGTSISEPGMDQTEFNRLMNKDAGLGMLLEFSFEDVVGKKYQTAVCASHLSTGAVALIDPRECAKSKEKK